VSKVGYNAGRDGNASDKFPTCQNRSRPSQVTLPLAVLCFFFPLFLMGFADDILIYKDKNAY
jgi:hypothetical protein